MLTAAGIARIAPALFMIAAGVACSACSASSHGGPGSEASPASAAVPSPATRALDPTTSANDAPSAARGIVIGQVVTHDTKVAIVGSTGGPHRELRYVVRKVDGTMIADAVTLAELRATSPEIYEVVTSARASNYADATLDIAHLN